MIRPVGFTFNEETAVNNSFQSKGAAQNAQAAAYEEFNALADLLQRNGIQVTIVDDTPEPHTPDSIFPNNWISFHEDGTIVLYPMFAQNRRKERKQHVIDAVIKQKKATRIIDLTHFEGRDIFLEGTGSMVLDRDNRIAYACLSPRTHTEALEAFCRETGYRPVTFTAVDQAGSPIYHTNVMMCVAEGYAVVCLDSIKDAIERKKVETELNNTGHEIIAITMEQVNHFAGNMLQVHNAAGKKFLVMSGQAYNSLTPDQVTSIERHNRILHSPLTTIETNGGGSARCMMAEVY